MKIAIFGSGDVGAALARGLVDSGHSVMIGTRNTDKEELKWTKKYPKEQLSTGSYTAAAAYGSLAILAVAWHAAENLLSVIRPELAGKVVIDVTNPLVFLEDGSPQLALGFSMSAGEIVQQMLADSHVVKTLNTVNYRHMVKPSFKNGTPTMFLCGNNPSAKKQVSELLGDLGWKDVADIGDIEKARLLEPLALLWVEYGASHDTWDHAFAILKK